LENILPSLRSLDSLKIGWPNNIKYSRLVTHLHALGRSIGSLSELHLKFRIPLNTQIETLIAYNLAYGPRRLTIELDNIEQNGVPDLYSEERLLFREEVSRSNFLHEVKVNSLESLTLLNCHVPDKFASQLQLRCDTNKIQNSGLLSNRITPSIWPYALQQLTTETTHDALFYLIRRRHSDFVPSRMDRHSLITRTMSASVVADSSVESDQMTMTTTTLSSRSSAMEQSKAIISTTSTVFSSLGGRPRRKKEIDESIFAFPTIDDGCGCVPWGKQQQIDLWEHETVTTNSSSDNNSKESYSSSDSSTAISAPTLLSNSSISTGSSYEMS